MSTNFYINSTSNPTMSRVYGNQFTSQYNQTRSAGTIGALDTTFTTGNSYIVPSHGDSGYAIQTLIDGTFLVLSSDTTSSWISQYTGQGVLDTVNFGAGNGFIALSGYSTVQFLSLDTQNRILVSGQDDKTVSHYPWISRIEPNGTVDTSFTFSDGASWTSSGTINQVVQQTSGSLIAVGFNGTNAMLARYNLAGAIDTTFGTATGYTILDGSTHTQTYPTSTVSLYSVVVDSSDRIYIAYVDATPSVYVMRLTQDGLIDTSWNSGNPVNLSYLNGTSMVTSQLRMILDASGDLIVAVPSGTHPQIKVASIRTSTAVTPGTFANVTLTGGVFGGSTINYMLGNLMATSNGSVYILGSNTSSKQMMIACYTSAGALDTAFNSSGVNFFTIATPDTSALLYSGAIAQTGEIYVAGSQINSATTTPYVSRLYNTQYVTAVSQFPLAKEQGILDQTFGYSSLETYPGVAVVVDGSYASCMQQQAVTALEVTTGGLPHGDIVVGINGLTDYYYSALSHSKNSYVNMMFVFLTEQGIFDSSAGYGGILTLENLTNSNEYMTDMLQDGAGNIYISGYTSSNKAIMRVYSFPTAGNAAIAVAESGSGWKGVGLSLQDKRTFLCVAESSTVGHITSYVLGSLDTTFGDAGSGYIYPTSYGLHMGPSYGLAVNTSQSIFAAYVDSSTSQVNLVKFLPDGSALDTTFNSTGIAANIFSGYTVNPENVRITFDASGNVIVAAVSSTDLLVACIDPTAGSLVETFNSGAILATPITGATSLYLTKVVGVSDGSIVVSFWDNAADDTMYTARVTSGGVIDTSFNSQGTQQGVLPIKVGDKVADYNARTANSVLVQSTAGSNQGNIVVVGYESVTSLDATPMAMRIYGQTGTTQVVDYQTINDNAGTLDGSFNLATNPAISKGFGNAVYVYPSTSAHAGKILVAVNTGTYSYVARLVQSTMTFDTTLNGSGTILIGLPGINSVNIDAQDNILVTGINDPYVWARVYRSTGSYIGGMNFNYPFNNFIGIYKMYQQKSGRYIIAGYGLDTLNNHCGILAAFQDHLVNGSGSFAPDPTFNPLSVNNSITAGQYPLAVTDSFYSLAINPDDTIVAVYANTATPKKAVIAVITADGSGNSNTTFNTASSGTPITTTISADSSTVVQVDIDASNNILVGASYNNGSTHQVQVARYSAAGILDTAGFGSSGIATITGLGTAGVALSQLMATTAGNIILTGYNTAGGHGPLFTSRLTSTGVLDTTWNVYATSPDVPGILTYQAFSSINVNNSAIGNDGTVLSIGSTTSLVSTSNPIVSLVYGTNLDVQVAQNPLEAPAGTKDSTIAGSSSGVLPLATLAVSGSVPGIPARMYIYNNSLPTPTVNSSPNGAMLLASTSGGNVYVTQLNSDLSLNSSHFGSSGIVTLTPNAATSPTSATVTDMYVANGTRDTAMPIYLTGYTTVLGVNTPFAFQIASNGSSYTEISPVSTLTTSGCIRQSTNSRVLVSGYNGSSGVVVSYANSLNNIDTSFGNNNNISPYYAGGYFATGVNTTIPAMTIDNLDRIYLAYQDGNSGTSSNILVKRLLENGTALDSAFNVTFTAAVNNYSTSQIKMAMDLSNYQLVVAAQDGQSAGNIIQVKRFDTYNRFASGAVSTITLPGAVLTLADLFIDSNQDIYVVGYISSGTGAGNTVVARLKDNGSQSNILLDTSYANAASPQGIANITEGAMSVVTAGALHPDRRVYVVGSDGSTNGYMGRLYGDYYWTQNSQAISKAQVGYLDGTMPTAYDGSLNLTAISPTGWTTLAGYPGRAIIANQSGDGSSFIAFNNNINLILGQLNADMAPVTGFGGNGTGLSNLVGMSVVMSIAQDISGNIIVTGRATDNTSQAVALFNSSGLLQAMFTPSAGWSQANRVAQQKSGRYIVASSNSSNYGLICAYLNSSAIVNPGSSGTLAVDQTFGPAGSNGYYQLATVNTIVDDLCIDSNDYIYFVYRVSGTVYLGKLTPEGSLSNSINTPSGQLWSTNPQAVSINNATQPAHIAINSAGNVLVGATTSNNSTDIEFQLFNASSGAAIAGMQVAISGQNEILRRLTSAGAVAGSHAGTEFYGLMNRTSINVGAFAVTNSGILDTSFGSSGLMPLTTAGAILQAYDASVQYDGKIIIAGNNNDGGYPGLIRVYGYPYLAQFNQAPEQISPGILDTTLWPTTGAFLLNNTVNTTFNSLISGYVIARVYEYGNGNMIFVANDPDGASGTVIFRLLKDLTLDTTFHTTGYIQLANSYVNAVGLYVDVHQNIYVAGNTSTPESWALGFSSNGTQIFNAAQSLDNVAQILTQANGRVITVGNIGTTGYLLGATISGTVDNTFGSATGQISLGINGTITDMAIDAHDNILTVANNAGSLVLQKVNPAGSLATDITSAGTAITAISGTNAKMILDTTGNIVVAAQVSAGFQLRSYINNNTGSGSLTGSNNAPTSLDIAFGSSGSAVLGNMYMIDGAQDKIILVGYDTTTGDILIARIISSGTGSTGAGTLALDTTFNQNGSIPGILTTTIGDLDQCFDGVIHADDRYMLVGSNSSTPNPYMGRVFGDTYASYDPQAPTGLPGTLDIGFGSTMPTNGYYDLTTLSSTLDAGQGKAIMPVANGGYYMVTDNGTNSFLLRTLGDGTLDTSFNPGSVTYQAGIAQSDAPAGAFSMMMNGSSQLVLAGTDGSGGWLQRYESGDTGAVDTTFGSLGVVALGASTTATTVVEQTLGRLVVAGSTSLGGALFGLQSLSPDAGTPGAVDVTFNSSGSSITSGGTNPGTFLVNSVYGVYNVVADQYDRLIFAVLNSDATGIDLYRLTSAGQYDITFGTGGKVTNALTTSGLSGSGYDATSIRVALDSVGNIVLAGYSYTAGTSTGNIKIVAYDNGTSSANGANGHLFTNVYTIPNLVGAGNKNVSLTDLMITADGYVLVLGNQTSLTSAASPSWIARFANTSSGGTYALDTTFNPNALNSRGIAGAGVAGIFAYTNTSVGIVSPYHVYNACTMNAQGTIGIIGYEDNGATDVPAVLQIFNDPYVAEESQFPDLKAVGTNDITLGASPVTSTNLGVTFFASSGAAASSGQVARAIALQNDANIIVAVDGGLSSGSSTPSNIYLKRFNIDGVADTTFGTSGQQTVVSLYNNQYVSDMIAFTTAGVHKAILAGYATNTTLNTQDSLLVQYNLDTQSLDSSFGGFDGDPTGVAFGAGKQLFAVSQQSTGRIIASGLSQDNYGLLLGYTLAGNLDNSFANNGYQSINTGSTGIYAHVIDTQNKIVIAYNDGSGNVIVSRFLADGSALDSTFNPSSYISGVTSNSNMKLALDSSNNVYVLAGVASGNSLEFVSYSQSNGALLLSTTITGNDLGNNLAVYTAGKLMIDTYGKIIAAVYDSNAHQIVVLRLTTDFILDTTFNTTGYIRYAVNSGSLSQIATDALIHPDGRILVVGSEN